MKSEGRETFEGKFRPESRICFFNLSSQEVYFIPLSLLPPLPANPHARSSPSPTEHVRVLVSPSPPHTLMHQSDLSNERLEFALKYINTNSQDKDT